MTKPYHLTQEQAFELAVEMDNHGFALTAYSDGAVDFHSSHILAEYVNAALDKVLGEPVATKLLPDPEDERDGLWFDLADIAKMKALPVGTKIYAPRREK